MKGRNISVSIGYLLLAIAAQAQTIRVTVPAGTRLRVKLETPVNTKHLLSDRVEATLIEPISLRGGVALPTGTHVSGRITYVQQNGGASLRLAFDTATLPDGGTLTAFASTSFRRSRFWRTAKMIGVVLAVPVVGAGIGAAVGGREGAKTGAGTGGAIALVAVLGAHKDPFENVWVNFKLKRGRKMWLRLDADLPLAPPAPPTAVGREIDDPSL